MTLNEFDIYIKKIKIDLFDENKSSFPSIYTLERIGNKLLEIVKQLQSEIEHLDTTYLSLKIDIDIYLADLTGELKHDYDKRNKRYKNKWEKEERKLVSLVKKVKTKLEE